MVHRPCPKRFIGGMVLALGMTVLGCEVTVRPERGPLELVPADAYLVMTLQWPTVRRYPELRRHLPIEDLEKELMVLGVSSDEVQQVVIFIGEGGEEEAETLILTGPRRGPAVGGPIERYDPYRLAYSASADRWFVHLRSGAWVFGSREALQAVIDVERNPTWGLAHRGPFGEVLRRVALSRRPISVFWRIPDVQRDIAQTILGVGSALLAPLLGPLADWTAGLDIARGFGLSVLPAQGRWMMELFVVAPSEKAAAQMSGALGLLRGLGSLVPEHEVSEEDRPYVEALKALTVQRDGTLLILTWPLPAE